MDAIRMLKKDHKLVKELFAEFESAGDRAKKKKRTLADKICSELTTHTMIEEKVFYPAVKAKGGELGDQILEAVEEHIIAKRLVAEISRMSAEDERFEAKVLVLKEMIEHHVEEEEKELFPKVRKVFDADELKALGARMEELKKPNPMVKAA